LTFEKDDALDKNSAGQKLQEVVILKFFLNVSRQEQKERFLDRIDRPEKNWKFDINDVRERGFWEKYLKAYEEVLNHTSTKYAPWYIIPADRKWFTRLVVAEIISQRLAGLNLHYPQVSEEHRQELLAAKKILEAEET
jgi:polyphosphate kinase 2 (PPK2 family)